jgi:hypothetical protein
MLVAHACHPKLHRKLRSGGLQFQAAYKKFARPCLNRKKLGTVAHTYYPC